jgi:hypothetical protein
MSASQAAEMVMNYSDEAGIPGPDSIMAPASSIGRIADRGIFGIVDAAISTSVWSVPGGQIPNHPSKPGGHTLVNTLLEVSTPPFGVRQFSAATLTPGANLYDPRGVSKGMIEVDSDSR